MLNANLRGGDCGSRLHSNPLLVRGPNAVLPFIKSRGRETIGYLSDNEGFGAKKPAAKCGEMDFLNYVDDNEGLAPKNRVEIMVESFPQTRLMITIGIVEFLMPVIIINAFK
jgi:hypothetical protein